MRPAWMIRKEEEQRLDRERARQRAWERSNLLARIADVCWDIDVWRDERPDTALTAALERLGERPTMHELRVEYGQLLRQACLRGVPEEEEVAA